MQQSVDHHRCPVMPLPASSLPRHSLTSSHDRCRHGTGTQVGDVAEATAVSNVFGTPRLAGQGALGPSPPGLGYKHKHGPIHIGSVKPNIGHTEAVSSRSSSQEMPI